MIEIVLMSVMLAAFVAFAIVSTLIIRCMMGRGRK